MDVSKNVQKRVLVALALAGAMGVLLGAFGAHGLKKTDISPDMLEAYRTGVFYHLVHVLALGLAVLAAPLCDARRWLYAVYCFFGGIFFFSGSLYAMALADAAGGSIAILGPLTPLGGVGLVLGWVFLAWSAGKSA